MPKRLRNRPIKEQKRPTVCVCVCAYQRRSSFKTHKRPVWVTNETCVSNERCDALLRQGHTLEFVIAVEVEPGER